MIGTRLAHYDITGHLGSGGMGVVYQATDSKLGRSVAIKLLPEEFQRDSERVARFEREARVLASLNHPRIAAIYGLENAGGQRFLVMELAPGETLAERVRRGPIPLEEALPIARQICEALEAAHEKGIVHRDLKPANIKITADGTVKVLDFGLAKAFESNPAPMDLSNSPTMVSMGATQAGVILGTAAYMSPEQAKGRSVDKQTDVWAFGCVLYEMLTGKQAFAGDDVTEILAAVVRGEPDWARLPSSTPSGIRTLSRRCLEKKQSERLHDIADARIRMDEAQQEPIVAKQKPSLWIPVAIVLGLLVVALGILWMRQPVPATHGGTSRSYVDLNPAGGLAFSDKIPGRPVLTAMSFSPDGQTLVYVARKDPASPNQLFRRPLDQLSAVPLEGTNGAENPFFSPDGQFVGFLADQKLKKIPLNGGPAGEICGVPDGLVGAVWTPDNMIVFGGLFHGLRQVSAGGGQPQPLTTLNAASHERAHVLPRLLPGGKTILFTIQKSERWEDAAVAVYDLTTREQPRVLIPDGAADARYSSTGHLLYMHAGTLMAVPFDAKQIQISGSPVALIEGVMQSVYMGNLENETLAGQFDMSSTGSLVYVTGGTVPPGVWDIVWVDRKGQVSAPLNSGLRSIGAPRISPDGKRIALVSADENTRLDIWVYDVDHQSSLRLTRVGREMLWPFWSIDGKTIVFSGADAFGRIKAESVAADGSGDLATLLDKPNVFAAALTPDGKGLLYIQGQATGPQEFWLLPMTGDRTPVPVLKSSGDVGYPEFSPDGHWLAYASAESGKPEVYVQAFPIAGEKHLVSTNGGLAPVWSHDGRELFYWGGEDSAKITQVWATDVRTGSATFESGKPHLLFSGDFAGTIPLRNYDVAADGQRFLMVKSVPSAPYKPVTQLVFVQNWFDELTRRVPAGH